MLFTKEIVKTLKWGEYDFTLKTGKIARQCDGSVVAMLGDTIVLCTIAMASEPKEGIDFFPLTVHYREMAFAAGKIPGGFIKREGKASDREVLISRLIDRSLRPLFPDNFYNETQIICTLLSYDPECSPDIVSIVGASAALAISGIPVSSIIAAAKVGLVNKELVLNPSFNTLKSSELEMVVSGSKDSILMVEAGASELGEDTILKAIEFAHTSFRPIISLIEELKNETAKKAKIVPAKSNEIIELENKIASSYQDHVQKAFEVSDKQLRVTALADIFTKIKNDFPDQAHHALANGYDMLKAAVLRKRMLHDSWRIGGRKLNEIRKIECEVSLLPRVHGSALFTRGETQSLAALTLGSTSDEQILESIEGNSREHFMLNYIFPPYSVGEASAFRAPGRREIGHGRLAWKAIAGMLPPQADFPYAVRVVSEITESNGSSSMATVCSTSLALMSAGVPMKRAVAGIAMGLILEGAKYAILSDILGDEDFLGDMDFKVAGTKLGVTALQMDIKVAGINIAIIKDALAQAAEGRIHILDIMNKTVEVSSNVLSAYAPAIDQLKIDKDKIRDLIGPGGKIIKDLCEKTSSKIDINDDGVVTIASPNSKALENAKNMINAIVFEPKIGDNFEGTVVKIIEHGAFINYGSKDGFLHISEISDTKVVNISDHLTFNQKIQVKVIGFDNKGKVRLSLREHNSNSNSNSSNTAPKKREIPVTRERYVKNTEHKVSKSEEFEEEKEKDVTFTEKKYFD